MVRPAQQIAALALLTTSSLIVHQLSKFAVHHGFGLIALILLFAALRPLSRYLD